MSFFEDFTIEDFKLYHVYTSIFTFNEDYLPYSAGTTYNVNDDVYTTQFKTYKSLINTNTQPLTDISAWEQTSVQDVVFDEFITKGLEYGVNSISHVFNNLNDTDSRKRDAFMLLSGHWLENLLKTRTGSGNGQFIKEGGVVSSASDGQNSFSLRQFTNEVYENNLELLNTVNGRKYLELLKIQQIRVPLHINGDQSNVFDL